MRARAWTMSQVFLKPFPACDEPLGRYFGSSISSRPSRGRIPRPPGFVLLGLGGLTRTTRMVMMGRRNAQRFQTGWPAWTTTTWYHPPRPLCPRLSRPRGLRGFCIIVGLLFAFPAKLCLLFFPLFLACGATLAWSFFHLMSAISCAQCASSCFTRSRPPPVVFLLFLTS